MNRYFISFAKVALVVGLFAWLLSSDRLNLSTLSLFVSRKEIFFFNFLTWLVCPFLLAAVRWQLILHGYGIHKPLSQVLSYQAIGLFFNTAMPGAVGGDVIKGIYLASPQEASSKATVFLTLLLDRFFGIFGLFLLGFIAITANSASLATYPSLQPLTLSTALIFFAIFTGLLWIAAPISPDRDPLHRLLRLRLPGFHLLLRLYNALCTLKRYPLLVIKASLLALLGHGVMMLYFWYLANLIVAAPLNFGFFSAIYPLGMLITTIPLAPGGLGLGHTTFDQLFSLVGVQGGADIFNLFILGQLALNCLGFVPFISLKKRVKVVEVSS
jgi:uncharacterized protein (TIRG00374 family)